jgi:hypothetical protein
MSKRILVSTKYGDCYPLLCEYNKGSIPTIRTAIDKNKYFENQAREIHGGKYDYSKVEYKNNKIPVKIIGPYGEFLQTPTKHLQNKFSPFTGDNYVKKSKRKSNSLESFIKKAKKVHGDLYDYSKVVYIKSNVKVEIISEHGSFWQLPNSHLSGHGCPILFQENCKTWSHTSWEKTGLKSKSFDSFKVYIIKCFNDDKSEVFYKIGKTFTTVEKRFKSKKNMPYNYEILKIIEGNSKKISELEIKLHKKYKKFKYKPLVKFGGCTECFIKD